MWDGRTTRSEDRATQLLICEPLSFAITTNEKTNITSNLVAPICNKYYQFMSLGCQVYVSCLWLCGRWFLLSVNRRPEYNMGRDTDT